MIPNIYKPCAAFRKYCEDNQSQSKSNYLKLTGDINHLCYNVSSVCETRLFSINLAWGWISRVSWWRDQMETFCALLVLCAGNSTVTGECPSQRPMTRSFDVFFDLHLNKRLSKQSCGWWFQTPPCPLWRHCNAIPIRAYSILLLFTNFGKWEANIYSNESTVNRPKRF